MICPDRTAFQEPHRWLATTTILQLLVQVAIVLSHGVSTIGEQQGTRSHPVVPAASILQAGSRMMTQTQRSAGVQNVHLRLIPGWLGVPCWNEGPCQRTAKHQREQTTEAVAVAASSMRVSTPTTQLTLASATLQTP